MAAPLFSRAHHQQSLHHTKGRNRPTKSFRRDSASLSSTRGGHRRLKRSYCASVSRQYPDLADGYVADPFNALVPAPHTTGGAVDLTLQYEGTALPLGCDFDDFHDVAAFRYFEDEAASDPEWTVVRNLRRLLAHTLIGEGFAPIANEWWHFSYGDQRWALFHGLAEAQFGQKRPQEF